MDPEVVKKIEERFQQETFRVFGGPPDEECVKYLRALPHVDFSKILKPNSHVVTHLHMEGITMVPSFARGYYESRKLKFNENDVFLASFPKTGTTWVQEIMYLIMTDLDFESAKSKSIDERFPFLEWPECTFETLKTLPSPKFIKTHLPFNLLPDGGCNKKYKIIYTTRNPKDTAISFYHFYRMIKPFQWVGDLEDNINMFLNDAALYCSFAKHALSYWNRRHDENVFVVKYEDLQKDPFGEIERMAKFLGKNFSQEQIKKIAYATSFQKMAANPSANHNQWEQMDFQTGEVLQFMRKGKVGDWKNHFDEALNKKFDEWIEKSFAGTDLKYDYEV